MRITYDAAADALAVSLADRGKAAKTVRQSDDVRLDYDAAGRLVGIEVLGASGHFEQATLARFDSPAVWLTLAQAAEESGLSAATLRGQLNNGRIKGEKRGRDWFVAQHELWTYLESRAPQGRPAAAKAPRAIGRSSHGLFSSFGSQFAAGGGRGRNAARVVPVPIPQGSHVMFKKAAKKK